jgi:cytoskeletal protein CcmA (bactofilin family)
LKEITMSAIATHLVKQQSLEAITSFVAENTRVKGDLEAMEGEDLGIKIDGTVLGSIKIPKGGTVHIGPTGSVEGELIEADYIFVEGRVTGTILSRRGVELSPSCTVKGQVQYHGAMNMHTLAKVRGTVEYMGD